MVRALLAGQKTVTRRVVKPQPNDGMTDSGVVDVARFNLGKTSALRCPYGAAGDRLWVRESFCPRYFDDGRPAFAADWTGASSDVVPRPKFKPGIHMPRAASRLTLDVCSVRAERLQDITDDEVRLEGVTHDIAADMINPKHAGEPHLLKTIAPKLRDAFSLGWDGINGKRAPWASNPWVWRVEFRKVEAAGGR
jgi:hypothetical protein